MPKPRTRSFDTSDFLDDDEIIAEYLTAALEESDPDVFLTAIGQVAKARDELCDSRLKHRVV